MPVYILHGFRWPRPLIRIHIILQNIDDAAAEWLVAPATSEALLDNFEELMPDTMKHLQHLRFIEQYDPDDVSTSAASQPYAYVADAVEEVKLGVDIDTIRDQSVESGHGNAIAELRDRLAPEEKVTWYVVVCGDEERSVSPVIDVVEEDAPEYIRNTSDTTSTNAGLASLTTQEKSSETSDTTNANVGPAPQAIAEVSGVKPNQRPTEPRPKGLSKVFGSFNRLAKKKSSIFSKSGVGSSSSNTSLPSASKVKRPQTSAGNA